MTFPSGSKNADMVTWWWHYHAGQSDKNHHHVSIVSASMLAY